MFGKKKNKDKEIKDKDINNKEVDEALNEALDENNVKEEVKKQDKESKALEKNEKKENKLNVPLGSVAKIIGGVILLVLGIVLIFATNGEDTTGNTVYLRDKLAVGVFGAIFIFYGAVRFVYLFKIKTDSRVKWLFLIEVILDLAVGFLLFFGGFDFKEEMNNYTEFMIKNFKYFLGAVLYIRGLLYLISSIFLNHKTFAKEFIVNLFCITFGTIILVRSEFNASKLAWVLVVLAILCGVYIAGDGGYHYIKLKKENDTKKEKKEKGKKKDKSIEKEENKKDTQIEKDIIDQDKNQNQDYAN